jgi:hypothetical protein
LTLCDLEDKGNQFYKLTAKETVEGERSTTTWFGRRLATVLRLRGVALQLRLAPLKLLLRSIASGIDESNLCGSYLRALGFEACRTKFDEYKLLL